MVAYKSHRKCLDLKESYVRVSGQGKQIQCPVLILLFILDVIVAALVALVGYFFCTDAHYNLPLIEGKYHNEFSVYCDDISLSPDDDRETFDTNKKNFSVSVNQNGRYICKFKRKHTMDMVQKVVERRSRLRLAQGFEDRPYLSCGNKSLAAKSGELLFMFSGVSRHQSYKGKSDALKLHWDKHPELSYVAPVIHYHNGEITIPEGRTYFVYASVHVNISKAEDNDKNYRPHRFVLRICRKTNGYEQTLLGTTKRFNVSNGHVVSSLNVGSYLQMSRNDTIYVKVSDANSIIHGSSGNTFGMFPLST